MPSPACEIKEGAGSYQSTDDGFDATPAATVTIHLIDTSVRTWTIECISTDETSVAATVTSSLSINTPAKTASFTAPSAGKAYRFRSTVNGGVDARGVAQASYSTTFCVYTLSGSNRVLAVDETTEGDSTFGWISSLNTILRSGGGGSTPTGTGVRKVVGGVEDAAASTIVNADVSASAAIAVTKIATGSNNGEVLMRTAGANVFATIANANVDAAAAIAGTKVAPDFGAQRIITTGGVTLGATPATAGDVRLKKDFTIQARDSANTADYTLFDYDAADGLYIGGDRAFTAAKQVGYLNMYATGALALGINANTGLYFLNGQVQVYQDQNLGILGGQSSPSYGSGTGVVYLGDASTPPSSNPTNGVIHYAENGVPRVRSESGQIRRLDHYSGGFSNVQRAVNGTLPDTAAGSTTVGATFRMLQAVHILGIRFFWPWFTATPSYTIKCSIWNESTTSQLATVDVAVVRPGVYEGFFSSPITTDLTAVDISAGLWEKSGTRYPRYAADSSFYNSLPIRMNDLVAILDTRKYSAGDARPTSNAATERYGLMDLILNT